MRVHVCGYWLTSAGQAAALERALWQLPIRYLEALSDAGCTAAAEKCARWLAVPADCSSGRSSACRDCRTVWKAGLRAGKPQQRWSGELRGF